MCYVGVTKFEEFKLIRTVRAKYGPTCHWSTLTFTCKPMDRPTCPTAH